MLALILQLAELVALQQPRVEMEKATESRDSKTYNIRVDCPNLCSDKVKKV